jgi:anti-anti-sigma factor
MAKSSEITVRSNGSASVIDIKGDVTSATTEPLETAYREVAAAGASNIVLVFANDCYINSGGIAILIGIVAESKRQHQTVRMTGLSAHFQKIFAMVGLTKYAQIYPSEDAAVSAP